MRALSVRCAVGAPPRGRTDRRQASPRASELLSAAAAHARAIALQALATAVVLSSAPDAGAALVSPNTRLPRSADVALRRAIPVVNAPTGDVQDKLEEVFYMLRIPQRKAWGTMQADVDACKAALLRDRESMLAAVPEPKRDAAAETLASLSARLDSLSAAVAAQDADVTSVRTAAALSDVAQLELAQAPGLPFLLPSQYASRPRLVGRAVVELQVERRGGDSFAPGLDGTGPQKSGTLRLVLDGYNAPLTAGNFAALVARGFFDGTPLSGLPNDEAVFALPASPSPLPGSLPLELRAQGEFEPRYRVPLDVQNGDPVPVLPLSVYGAVAMARGQDGNDSSSTAWFFYRCVGTGGAIAAASVAGAFLIHAFVLRYARNTAGLGGLAFEEGAYSVYGYVTEGQELLRQLRSGDVIRNAKLVSGAENLVLPPAQ